MENILFLRVAEESALVELRHLKICMSLLQYCFFELDTSDKMYAIYQLQMFDFHILTAQ